MKHTFGKPSDYHSNYESCESRAFDTISHNVLLQKLYHYGFRGIALDWFTDYLYNCSYFILMTFVMYLTKYLVYYLLMTPTYLLLGKM